MKDPNRERSDAFLAEACSAYLESLRPEPQQAADSTEPSGGFEARMQQTLQRPARRAASRLQAAAVLLVVALTGMGLFSVSVQAKDDLSGWFHRSEGAGHVYEFEMPLQPEQAPLPSVAETPVPTWLPKGWQQASRSDSPRQTTVIYTDSSGVSQYLSILPAAEGASMMLIGTQAPTVVSVGSHYGELYEAGRVGLYSTLVWEDADGGLLFVLSSTAPAEQLLKIAESVS